jgi:hypothetical protein
MSFDPTDSRFEPREPGPEEIEAWARREHGRRQAWLAGPSEEEKQEWARRYRRRASLGLEESRLGPTREEADRWAEREHARRQAWQAGPDEDEKRQRARDLRSRSPRGPFGDPMPISDEEVDDWAARERQRRQEWLAGPTEEEKQRWARREATGGWVDWSLADLPGGLSDAAQRFLREAELAGKGSLYALSRAPMIFWSYFVRAGRAFEQEFYQQPPRGRVRY